MGWNIFKLAACSEIQASIGSYPASEALCLSIFSLIFCVIPEGRAGSRFCSDLNPIILLTSITETAQKVSGKGNGSLAPQQLPAPLKWLCGSLIKITIYIIYLFISIFTNLGWKCSQSAQGRHKPGKLQPTPPIQHLISMRAININTCRRRQRTHRG